MFPNEEIEVQTAKKELSGIAYEEEDDGRLVFDDIGIGGEVNGEDFRDFIVAREDVGVRMDSTLVLPKGTEVTSGTDKKIHFTLPRSKQRGVIFTQNGSLYATPE